MIICDDVGDADEFLEFLTQNNMAYEILNGYDIQHLDTIWEGYD